MKLLATLGAVLFSGLVAATPLHNVVVFGDSLSDNGNLYEFMKRQLPQSPPYFDGRFTNGQVWIEILMANYYPNSLSSHLFDYAFGGAGVSEEEGDDALFTLRREVNSYLLSHDNKANDDSLYVVWIGANNYLGMPEDAEGTLKAVNVGIRHSLELLADKGAKHFLLLNLPDLGKIPAAYEFNAVDMLTHFSMKHNEALLKTIDELKERYPDASWHFYDMGAMFNQMLEHPADFGFTNVNGTCVSSITNQEGRKSVLNMVAGVKPMKGKVDCSGYLFFDLVHPTALAHQRLAENVKEMFDKEGMEFAE